MFRVLLVLRFRGLEFKVQGVGFRGEALQFEVQPGSASSNSAKTSVIHKPESQSRKLSVQGLEFRVSENLRTLLQHSCTLKPANPKPRTLKPPNRDIVTHSMLPKPPSPPNPKPRRLNPKP